MLMMLQVSQPCSSAGFLFSEEQNQRRGVGCAGSGLRSPFGALLSFSCKADTEWIPRLGFYAQLFFFFYYRRVQGMCWV